LDPFRNSSNFRVRYGVGGSPVRLHTTVDLSRRAGPSAIRTSLVTISSTSRSVHLGRTKA